MELEGGFSCSKSRYQLMRRGQIDCIKSKIYDIYDINKIISINRLTYMLLE